MAIAFVVGASAASTNNNTATTAGVDTTGANFTCIAHGDFSARATESDSKGNTYTDLTAQNNAGNRGSQLHYCENPTVGTGHTATATSTLGYPAIHFAAFSGVATSSVFDQQNGAKSSSSVTSFSPGSVTPSENNELVVTCVCTDRVTSQWAAPSGYTQVAAAVPASANAVSLSTAYQIQTTATATNPAWTGSSSVQISSNVATFKEAAAAGFSPYWAMQRSGVVGSGVN